MRIFNEDLEKHLLYDELNEFLTYTLPATLVFFGIFFAIAFIFGNIVFKAAMALTNNSLSDFFQLIIVSCVAIVLLCISHHIMKFVNKIFKPSIPLSNPILIKLKNAAKQKDHVNLVKLWKHFNPEYQSDSIVLGQHQKDIKLLQKLDDDLVCFIKNEDDITIKLFNLDDFESYRKLYMKYIAPEQKQEIVNQIQTLIVNQIYTLMEHHYSYHSEPESHLIQQLHSLKNEIEEYNTNTSDYFEFKKWHKDKLDMLKLDKDNVLVKKAYQNTIQKINTNKKED